MKVTDRPTVGDVISISTNGNKKWDPTDLSYMIAKIFMREPSINWLLFPVNPAELSAASATN